MGIAEGRQSCSIAGMANAVEGAIWQTLSHIWAMRCSVGQTLPLARPSPTSTPAPQRHTDTSNTQIWICVCSPSIWITLDAFVLLQYGSNFKTLRTTRLLHPAWGATSSRPPKARIVRRDSWFAHATLTCETLTKTHKTRTYT